MRRRAEPETATVVGVSHDGRGIAAPDGKKVFVAGALCGETVRIVRRRRRKSFDEAELLEILEPSPLRVEPRCAAHGICGGCSLQQLPTAEQRAVKAKALADNLERLAGLAPRCWLEPVYDDSEGGYRYRRRARLAVRDVPAKGRVLVGFRERLKPYVADMHRCEVLAPPADALIDPLSELIGRLSLRSRVPQIEVAVGENATELVFRVLDPPDAADRALLSEFARDRNLRLSLQSGGAETVSLLYPQRAPEPLYYSLPDFDLRIAFSATDFVQVNARVNRLMVARPLELLEVSPEHRVLDLYCGIGNFSLPLARLAGDVLGIEGAAGQVERAAANAAANGIRNARFRVVDLDAPGEDDGWPGKRWDRILIDPPRSGAEAVMNRLGETGAGRVVYVSCHPATLARDAAVLTRTQGYRLEAAGIVDLFPHTAHAEAMAVFVRE